MRRKLYIRFYAHSPEVWARGHGDGNQPPLAPEQKQALEALIRAVRESGEYSLPLFGGKTTNYHWLDWGLDDPDKGSGANEVMTLLFYITLSLLALAPPSSSHAASGMFSVGFVRRSRLAPLHASPTGGANPLPLGMKRGGAARPFKEVRGSVERRAPLLPP